MLPGVVFLLSVMALLGIAIPVPAEDAALVTRAGFVQQHETAISGVCGEAESLYTDEGVSHTIRVAWPLPYGCEDVRYTVTWEVGRVVAVERFRASLDAAGPVGSEARGQRSAEIAAWYVWSLGIGR